MNKLRILILGLVICVNSALATPQEIDKITAIVNNSVVLESDINILLQSIKFNALQTGKTIKNDQSLRLQIIERLIMDSIQIQIAQKIGILVPDSDIDNAIANIAKKNNMSCQQLRKRLSYEGIDYKNYRSQIHKEMLINTLRNNEVQRRVTILPHEIEGLKIPIKNLNSDDTEINISHIMLSLPENPSQQQINTSKALATRLIIALRNGADFAKLAMIYSTDDQAPKGGYIGWNRIQELPTLFTEYLSNPKKGLIIGPIRSDAGFHILKVNDIHHVKQSKSITEVHVKHILLKPSSIITNDQVLTKLANFAKDIKSGRTTFTNVVQDLSQDTRFSLEWGDLGWNAIDTYDPMFRDALLKLNKGELSAPIHSAVGWHLIQLIDIHQVDKNNTAQKNQAYRILFNRKFTEEMNTWMQELRAQSYVKILNHYAKK
ncbi:peptidyl-prolyl cis-trans isomerase [Serratia symbiotica str. 'Cinara cedri']|nr:peptidyl-prolyl cis-trans isomerase [Serratia symbiotica str. 'Cinara cedri']